MSTTTPPQRRYSPEAIDPATARPSRCRMQRKGEFGQSESDKALIRNVESRRVVVEKPIARYEDGELRILDGMRRLNAAAQAGLDSVSVLVCDVDDTEALSMSLTLHATPFRKSVTDADRSRATERVAADRDEAEIEVETDLGLVTQRERIELLVGEASGVGEVTVDRLLERFGSVDRVRAASESDLTDVPGIGDTTARSIREITTSDERYQAI